VDPVPDPLLLRENLVAPGIQPGISGSVARNYAINGITSITREGGRNRVEGWTVYISENTHICLCIYNVSFLQAVGYDKFTYEGFCHRLYETPFKIFVKWRI
jgi:hypothetical protein